MKKISLLSFLFITAYSCNHNKTETIESVPADKRVSPKLEFITDKNLETLYIVFLLSDYPVLSPYPNRYKTDALAYFEKYKEHSCVTLTREMVKKGFVADYAVNWLYQYSDFPELKKTKKINFPFEMVSINTDSLELLRKELIIFYNETNCERFLKDQNSYFENMVTSVKDSFSRKDIISVIEDYFGMKKEAGYYVVLSPLLHSGGFAVERTDKNELFALIGPGGVKDSIPVFDKEYIEWDMVIHEFSHNYANPVTEEFMAQTKEFEKDLFPLVMEKTDAEGYGTWESFITELIVRATTIRIVENIYGKEAAQELTEYETSVGFDYVVEITGLLKNYEKQRDKYPAFRDFFPEILIGMKKIQSKIIGE